MASKFSTVLSSTGETTAWDKKLGKSSQEFYAPKTVSTSSSLLSPRLYERILQAREKVKGRSRGRASTIFAGQYSQPGRTMLNLFGSSQLKRLLGE